MMSFTISNYNQESLDTILRLAYIAESREWDNRAHIERVRFYCYLICRELEMSQKDTELISTACVLHDVGKIVLPEIIIKNIENYNPVERAQIEKHTIEGGNLLANSKSPFLQIGEIIAMSHHERWDGSGYPNNLKGEEIPLPGRICAVADVFDSLTSQRVYKPTISTIEAFNLILKASGSLFDPKIVSIFTDKRLEIQRIYDSLPRIY